MDAPRRLLTLAVLAGTVMAMTACQEEEQDRVLYQIKGVYQGEPDSPLQDDTVDELRQRALRQAG